METLKFISITENQKDISVTFLFDHLMQGGIFVKGEHAIVTAKRLRQIADKLEAEINEE
jgi:hypothetical protein